MYQLGFPSVPPKSTNKRDHTITQDTTILLVRWALSLQLFSSSLCNVLCQLYLFMHAHYNKTSITKIFIRIRSKMQCKTVHKNSYYEYLIFFSFFLFLNTKICIISISFHFFFFLLLVRRFVHFCILSSLLLYIGTAFCHSYFRRMEWTRGVGAMSNNIGNMRIKNYINNFKTPVIKIAMCASNCATSQRCGN